jgi:hypothetical protein
MRRFGTGHVATGSLQLPPPNPYYIFNIREDFEISTYTGTKMALRTTAEFFKCAYCILISSGFVTVFGRKCMFQTPEIEKFQHCRKFMTHQLKTTIEVQTGIALSFHNK